MTARRMTQDKTTVRNLDERPVESRRLRCRAAAGASHVRICDLTQFEL